MKDTVKKILKRNRALMNFPPYDVRTRNIIRSSPDPVRHGMVALAINLIKKNQIDGGFAEVGVYRGDTSKIIHALAPERTFYLFDTFEGFRPEDSEYEDDRFKDTTIAEVKERIGDLSNIKIRPGYFPETATGLEDEVFSFVMLDVDKYEPTLAGLEFFYPRVTSGAYIFVHDYNSPESNYAVSRAVNKFMRDKPEKFIEMPDVWGSIVIRRI